MFNNVFMFSPHLTLYILTQYSASKRRAGQPVTRAWLGDERFQTDWPDIGVVRCA